MYGFYRITVASPRLHLGSTDENKNEILGLINQSLNSSVILFPELCITGYSVGDMFFNKTLYDAQISALDEILQETKNISSIIVLGIAVMEAGRLYNCGIVLQNGNILGIVPKSYLPNKREFYEKRHFTSGLDARFKSINICGIDAPFGTDLILSDNNDMIFGIEICEDLWALTPPSNQLASNGATLILNLSASNELVGKSNYRADLVKNQSARLLSVYAYSSSGVYESTSDTIFGGDCIICEYGSLLSRTKMYERTSQLITSDVDLQKLSFMRLGETSFCDSQQSKIRKIICKQTPKIDKLNRFIDPHPFVPKLQSEKELRCEEIVKIQANALITRLESAKIKKVVIGVSGGLDSTLALLVCDYAFRMMSWNKEDIIAITMEGFGTTHNTKSNAHKLCETLGIALRDIPIADIATKEFKAIGHDESDHSVVYENVQARIRTTILMNIANKEGGLVIGTGDMSEIALGWNTYNGDHMSMYGLNSGVPKTLVKFLVEYFQKGSIKTEVLQAILDTPISPELLPHDTGVIQQETEKIIGPYELHDFFLYHMLKYGATPSKILYLARLAFEDKYNEVEIKKWLVTFLKRFFTQQFKRNAMPDGPKVGTISLSPRADLRMPSEMNFNIWIDDLDK
jgi:NAD+ synthase (glutamine-hydrolysing)